MEEAMDIQEELTPDNSPQHSAFGGDDTESEEDDESSNHVKPKGTPGNFITTSQMIGENFQPFD